MPLRVALPGQDIPFLDVKAPQDFNAQSLIPQDPINLSSTSNIEDLKSTYYTHSEGEVAVMETFEDLKNFLDKPKKLGIRKGKELRFFPEEIQRMAREQDVEEAGQSKPAEHSSFLLGEDNSSDSEVMTSLDEYEFEYSSDGEPYVQRELDHEVESHFIDEVTEAEKVEARKFGGIVSCSNITSNITSGEFIWIMEYMNLDGKFFRPRHNMRMHIFNIPDLPTTRMLITNRLAELGFGCPMHRYLQEIFDTYNLGPIQLSPDS